MDVAAYIDHLLAQPSVRQGSIGTVGYCFGGAMSLLAAATRPQRVAAAASFHGGGLYKPDDETSPHLLLPKVTARLYFGHAVEDKSMNAEAIKEFEHALRLWQGKSESEVYEGAHHGWTVPDNPAFNPVQAARAFEKLTELFAATLG
jgi:carboxymethylenebutenolidase